MRLDRPRLRPRKLRPPRRRGRPQNGNTLIIALVVTIVISTILAALLSFSSTSNSATRAFSDVRDERYAASGAIDAAVNWAAGKTNVARDPSLTSGDPTCLYQVPTDSGVMTVSCAADAGGGSGKPAEGGLLPPESLLLTGTRVNWTGSESEDRNEETGPYNTYGCKGWWDSAADWFSVGVDPNAADAYKETSIRFRPRVGLGGFLGSSCADRARTFQTFKVSGGNVVAAGRIVVDNGSLSVIGTGTKIKARQGCSGTTCDAVGTRVAGPNVPADLVGTPEDSDPGRPYPSGASPTDIKSSWLPVGFNADGSARALGYTATTLMPSSMPERTTAYIWDPATESLTASATCGSTSQTVVFLPGWYRDASVLNRYTGPNSLTACADRTFWFAPDPGPDGKLLTGDDLTGGFYFDFRNTSSAWPCGRDTAGNDIMPADPSLWCIGRYAAQNSRVVAGTPKNWSPLGADVSANRVNVVLPAAQTIDDDLSVKWYSPGGAERIDDGSVAYYKPCSVLGLLPCPSYDRSIRVRAFTPSATGGPVSDTGFPNGRIFLSLHYGLQNGTALNNPTATVTAVTKQSGQVNCGTYTLPKPAYSGSGTLPATYRFTDSQAKQLADACGKVDLINGFEVLLKFTGDPFNGGGGAGVPKVFLDGVKIDFDSVQGASFPLPTSASSPVNPAAKSDCDTTRPGAQFIFGGTSHAYIADGSMEVCAGAYPTSPEDHQVIGVWAMPEVRSLKPTSVAGWGGKNASSPANPGNATTTDQTQAVIDSRQMTINYGCAVGCGDWIQGYVDLAMPTYSPPSGYVVSQIKARVSYNPKNQGCSFLWSCPGEAPALLPPNLDASGYSCPSDGDTSNGRNGLKAPKNPNKGPLQYAGANFVLYNTATGRNCITPGQLASGHNIRWSARADCTIGICGGSFTDTLDGIEYDITLKPADDTKPRLIPQAGCIVAHPNYNAGEGKPDCALLRSDSSNVGDTFSWPWNTREGQAVGRISIRGTIYAPSSAVEVDDTDFASALASRGAVLRHLRLTGFGARCISIICYSDPPIQNGADRVPAPREATFTACLQSDDDRAAGKPCAGTGAAGRVLVSARVRFEIDPTSSVVAADKARVPRVLWWSGDI